MPMIAMLMLFSQRMPRKILSSTKFWGCLDYCLGKEKENCQQNNVDHVKKKNIGDRYSVISNKRHLPLRY